MNIFVRYMSTPLQYGTLLGALEQRYHQEEMYHRAQTRGIMIAETSSIMAQQRVIAAQIK